MAGFFGHGSTLSYDSVPVGGVLDIPIPAQTREEVEITDMDSNFNREFVPGLIDNGTLDMTFRWVPGDAGQQAMLADLATQTVVEIVVTSPTHVSPQETITFDAFIQTFGGTLFWEGQAAERTVTLRVSSGVAYA